MTPNTQAITFLWGSLASCGRLSIGQLPRPHKDGVDIIASYARDSVPQRGDEEGLCAIKIILKTIGKTTKLAVW